MPLISYKKLANTYADEILRLRKREKDMKSIIKQQEAKIEELTTKYKAGYYTYRERVGQLEARLNNQIYRPSVKVNSQDDNTNQDLSEEN